MSATFDLASALPPKAKVWRSFFLLILLGLTLYFLLPQLTQINHALQVAVNMRIPFVALSLGASSATSGADICSARAIQLHTDQVHP